MKKLLLPIFLLLAGIGGGIGAGLVLKPEQDEVILADGAPCGDAALDSQNAEAHAPVAAITEEREYSKLNNQFVIPVVKDGVVAALVVMAISLEVLPDSGSAVLANEPKLRDGFLQVMFDHANLGGFSGNFTEGTNMQALRNELRRVAQQISGDNVTDVLITDMVRQDS